MKRLVSYLHSSSELLTGSRLVINLVILLAGWNVILEEKTNVGTFESYLVESNSIEFSEYVINSGCYENFDYIAKHFWETEIPIAIRQEYCTDFVNLYSTKLTIK